MYRASYRNVCINQRIAQILVNNLHFFVKWLYMFRTMISPSSGVTFNKLYSAIGTCRYVWLLYGYIHTAARHTGIYQLHCQLIKRYSWWWTNDSPKHSEPFNEKIKIIQKNLRIPLVYIHKIDGYIRFCVLNIYVHTVWTSTTSK